MTDYVVKVMNRDIPTLFRIIFDFKKKSQGLLYQKFSKMEIPEDATRGILYDYKQSREEEKEEPYSFIICARDDEATIRIRWNKPCYYCVPIEGDDYMSKYFNTEGMLTKRKNGKWMFKGHQRLYSYYEVKFY